MKHCRSFCTSAAAAAWMLLAAPAQATDPTEKDQCIGAADNGQQLRDDGKYKLAQEAFARCARERCPVLVRQDCNQWAQELDEMRPSIVFRAQNANGQDLTDVAVKVDDEPLVSSLDGQALPMDPGEHLFVFEAAGLPPVEQRVVISQGEKKRAIVARFKMAVVSGSPSPVMDPPSNEQPTPPRSPANPIPIATLVFGGAALVAFASETYFGIAGLSSRSADLGRGGCAPSCSASEKSSIETDFEVADVSLAIGLVSASLAAYFFISSRGSTPGPATAVDVTPRPGGGVATVAGTF